MANETEVTPQVSREESTINLMNGTVDFASTNVVASNVGELRSSLGLSGTVTVNNIIASDATPIRQGNPADPDACDDVVHVDVDKKGGNS
jgi:hypothetical protein